MRSKPVPPAIAASAILALLSAPACEAQVVVIGFGPNAVPLASWAAALAAGMLALTGAVLLHRRRRAGWFVLLLSAAVGGGLALNSERLMALVVTPTINLVTSPATTPNLAFNVCTAPPFAANTLTVNTSVPVVINSLSVSPVPPWLIDSSSTCRVGQTVTTSCTIVLDGRAGCT
jgi:hypothetical protein